MQKNKEPQWMELPVGIQGKFAIIDIEDYDKISSYSWHIGVHGYVISKVNKNHRVFMHRIINNTPSGMDTDHINGIRHDNRKCNLRTADKHINQLNRGMTKRNTTGYKGVTITRYGFFQAQIKIHQKNLYLGTYKDPVSAAIVYAMAHTLYSAKGGT